MELIDIEISRIIFLTQVRRPSGQIYLPDAIAQVVERYSFVKAPNSEQQLPYTFSVGKFQNSQITELSLYNDGLIVSSKSDTDLLDSFLDDLLPWAMKEFGLIEVAKPEKHYESNIVVRSSVDLALSLKPQNDLSGLFSAALRSAGIGQHLKPSGFIFDFDSADVADTLKRRPHRFLVDRRIGLPFSHDTFFSQAPFKTSDHLRVLESIEKMQKP